MMMTRFRRHEALGGEKAFFTAPQMTPGVSHRQDVCDRYFAFQNGTMELRDALQGIQLNVLMGAYNGSYFNYDPENGIDSIYPGIAGVLMDELAKRAGFAWRGSFGIFTDPKGADFNESWTDVLAWGVENYDLNVDWWARNLERMNMGVAFTKEWYDSSIILIGKKDPDHFTDNHIGWSHFLNWLKPFNAAVWWTTVATIIISGMVFQVLEYLVDERQDRKFWVWFSENIYLSAMNATQAYEYGTPKSVSSKIFGFSMALWALILTATYTANLASLLVDRQDKLLDVETIEEAAVFGYPVCTFAGTNSDTYVEQVYPSAIRRPKSTIEEVYDGLNDGECAFAVEVTQSWLGYKNKRQFNPTCNLEWIGDGRTISPSSAGFATKADAGFKCTGLVRDVINLHMEELISEGFIDDTWDYENRRYQDVDCETFRPELLEELNAEEGADNERRRSRRRMESAVGSREQTQSRRRHRRQLKASTKAASSAGAVGGDSEQMELEAMIGSFFVHWMLMAISIVVAIVNRYLKSRRRNLKLERTKHVSNPESDEFSGDHKGEVTCDKLRAQGGEEPNASDLQRQIEDMKRSFESSQAIMMKGQDELRGQIATLLGMMSENKAVVPKSGRTKHVPNPESDEFIGDGEVICHKLRSRQDELRGQIETMLGTLHEKSSRTNVM
eukprot:scaffold5234_cov131-Cylindrotheca_fusiformis.AAC.12